MRGIFHKISIISIIWVLAACGGVGTGGPPAGGGQATGEGDFGKSGVGEGNLPSQPVAGEIGDIPDLLMKFFSKNPDGSESGEPNDTNYFVFSFNHDSPALSERAQLEQKGPNGFDICDKCQGRKIRVITCGGVESSEVDPAKLSVWASDYYNQFKNGEIGFDQCKDVTYQDFIIEDPAKIYFNGITLKIKTFYFFTLLPKDESYLKDLGPLSLNGASSFSSEAGFKRNVTPDLNSPIRFFRARQRPYTAPTNPPPGGGIPHGYVEP